MDNRTDWCEIHLSASAENTTVNLAAESRVHLMSGLQMILLEASLRLHQEPDEVLEILKKAIDCPEIKEAFENMKAKVSEMENTDE